MKGWLQEAGLSLAEEKSEVIFLNRKKIPRGSVLEPLGCRWVPSKVIKYLGITLDPIRKFRPLLAITTNKAVKVMAALGRLLPKLGGPGADRSRLYYYVMESIMVYEAPMWADV